MELTTEEKGRMAYKLIKYYLSKIMFQEKGVIHGFSEDDLKKIGLNFNPSLKDEYKQFLKEAVAEVYLENTSCCWEK